MEPVEKTATKIGSPWTAEQVSKFTSEQIATKNLPLGYKILGQSGRVAILGPDGVVYKRSRYNGGFDYTTKVEADNFQILQNRGYSWAPEFTYYQEFGIIAMKEYKVDRRRYPTGKNLDILDEIEEVITDTHNGNIGYDENDSLVLIDGGGSIYG